MSDFIQQDFARQKADADKHNPALKKIVSDVLHVAVEHVRVATDQEDRHEGSDLMVSDLLRIACRVRDFDQLRYDGQFTIRLAKNTRGLNELMKMTDGYGDFMLYAFQTADGQRLLKWYLLDLRVFRRAAVEGFAKLDMMMSSVHTDRCRFQPFLLDAFGEYGKLLVASSDEQKAQQAA